MTKDIRSRMRMAGEYDFQELGRQCGICPLSIIDGINPWHTGLFLTWSLDKLKAYDGTKTVTVRLDMDRTIFDVDWFSIYSVSTAEVFADITIPDDPNIPPYLDAEPTVVSWTRAGS